MESLNRIELIGKVGVVTSHKVGDSIATRFAVCTTHLYDNGSSPVLENTWFPCISFDDNASALEKGDDIHLEGRVKTVRYTDSEGKERTQFEVVVNKIY